MALPKQYRLKKKKDFDLVFKKGKTIHDSFLFLKAVRNGQSHPRIACVVSLKISKKAVERNMLRRAINSVSEQCVHQLGSWDIVVVVTRPESVQRKKEVQEIYRSLLQKLPK